MIVVECKPLALQKTEPELCSLLILHAIFREVGGGVKQTLHFPAALIRAKILSITVTRREEVKFESIHSNSALAFLLSIY